MANFSLTLQCVQSEHKQGDSTELPREAGLGSHVLETAAVMFVIALRSLYSLVYSLIERQSRRSHLGNTYILATAGKGYTTASMNKTEMA